MADPPSEDAASPDASESQLLTALWDLLERALELSTAADALDRRAEILELCQAAVALLRDGTR
jgi:hypothetical protein